MHGLDSRQSMTAERTAVLIDGGVPQPDRDGGSRAVADLLQSFAELEWQCDFLALDDQDSQRVAERLLDPPWSLVVVSRPGPASRLLSSIRTCPRPTIYLGHDLHHLRIERGDGKASVASRAMAMLERACWKAFDVSAYPVPSERDQVASSVGSRRAATLPYFRTSPVSSPPMKERSGLIFVGSSAHAPNRAGLLWFFDSVWPRVLERNPSVMLTLVGAWWDLHDQSNVQVAGNVSDQELDQLVAHARVAVAPLTFGAGMKAKMVCYLSASTPSVGTSEAWAGLGLPDQCAARDSGEEFADEILRLLTDDEAWHRGHAAASRIARDLTGERQVLALSSVIEQAVDVHVRGLRVVHEEQ